MGSSSAYTSGAYGNRSRSRHWKQENLSSKNQSSKNQIYVNHSFHMATYPRDVGEGRPEEADQLSQDQIELVTNAQGVSLSKGL